MEAALDLKPSILFDWTPTIFSADNGRDLLPNYRVTAEAGRTTLFVRPRFQDLPSFGMWADRTETDEELLERLRGDWRELGDRD